MVSRPEMGKQLRRGATSMNIDLTGRTAVITGGSRGLGEAMAKALAESGAKIALVARDAIANSGGTADLFIADVTQEDQVAKLSEAITQRFGAAQILINNAGTNI